MKLSKEIIIERLQSTSVHDLAIEITDQTAVNGMNREATIAKYESMLKPFAPVQTIKATDALRSLGVTVVKA